jgi:glucosamine-6-phosphate deaminase
MTATWSSVESAFLAKSGRQDKYDGENIPVVEVLNVYELGKIVALEFMEWARIHPEGVVALPTGRTPEYFIKTLGRYKDMFQDPVVRAEIVSNGYTHDQFPDTSGLTFVMLDEFFPILPSHRNAFCSYIKSYYLPLLGVNADKVLDFDLLARKVLTLEELDVFKSINVDISLLGEQDGTLTADTLIQKQILQKVQAYCDQFEQKLAAIGGIGFFLGGIGPDGHIAFNQEGCAHNSRTRLVNFNYMSAAAAAGDLGGIEIARGKAAVTIGLATITANPAAKIIIMAAGEGKAMVVRAAIEDEASEKRPSSCLHGNSGARYYLTHGAASQLTGRRAESVAAVSEDQCLPWALKHLADAFNKNVTPNLLPVPAEFLTAETLVHRVSLARGIPVHKLCVDDLGEAGLEGVAAPDWIRDPMKFQIMAACISRRLRERVEAGLVSASPIGMSIVHTAPHHDDIMLSYHGAMHEMLGRDPSIGLNEKRKVAAAEAVDGRSNRVRSTSGNIVLPNRTANGLGEAFNSNVNHFAYLTSGFHSVNDSYIQENVDAVLTPVTHSSMFSTSVPLGTTFLHAAVVSGEITRDYDELMCDFNDAFSMRSEHTMDQIENVLFLRRVAEVWNLTLTCSYDELSRRLIERVEWVRDEYLAKHQPGDGIPKDLQLLKGCMREAEVDRVWALSRMPMNRIHHLRSQFYTDDFFTPMPTLEGDALPMANLLRARQPDLITVAFDPEGTGPDTHYKVLQVVAAGLRVSLARKDLINPNPMIWGYRNVWFIFTPSEATIMVPCSSADLDLMHDTFMHCFTTQKTASYPSPHYDGSFSALSRHLQIQHRQTLGTLLGEEFFEAHSDPRVRNAAGFILIKAMFAETFLREVEELKNKFENVTKAV